MINNMNSNQNNEEKYDETEIYESFERDISNINKKYNIRKFKSYIPGLTDTVNTYLIHNKEKAILFDAGAGTNRIKKYLKENNLKLEKLVLTHCHYDHINEIDNIKFDDGKEINHIEIYISLKEKEGYENENINLLNLVNKTNPKTKIDKYLNEGDIIKFEDLTLEIIETPGHTIGSICIYIKELDILVTGDTIFKNSFGRVDLPTGSYLDMMTSLKKIKDKFKEPFIKEENNIKRDLIFLPGHGNNTTYYEEYIEKTN